MSTPEEIAWAAGLFEGEGTFSLKRHASRPAVELRAALSTTDLDVLEHFVAVVGCGKVRPHRQGAPRPGYKPQWRWEIRGLDVARVYTMFAPWLGERRTQQYATMLVARMKYEEEAPLIRRRASAIATAAHYPERGYIEGKLDA